MNAASKVQNLGVIISGLKPTGQCITVTQKLQILESTFVLMKVGGVTTLVLG